MPKLVTLERNLIGRHPNLIPVWGTAHAKKPVIDVLLLRWTQHVRGMCVELQQLFEIKGAHRCCDV
jgi:hypothetical protein